MPSVSTDYALVPYRVDREPRSEPRSYLFASERAVLIGQGAARKALNMYEEGYRPDLIIGHSGFGELTFLPDVFPGTPILAYAEYFYRSAGADVGFDPELTVAETEFTRIRLKNALTLASLDAATAAYAPTLWQRNCFPSAYHKKIHVVHDGVNTATLRENPSARLRIATGKYLTADTPVITFAARALEHYRGFHKFWPALAMVLQRNPATQAVVVGGRTTAYGPEEAGTSLVDRLIGEYPVDLSRVHFFEALDREAYTTMLQISSCHVYLTYPFIPSWSLIEALSCGAPVVAADVPPVREIVGRGTCALVDFFDIERLAKKMEAFIRDPSRTHAMRVRARTHAVKNFDFQQKSWPRLRALIQNIAGEGRVRPAGN